MTKKFFSVFAVLSLGLFISNTAFAHCDTMDGPVINAAQTALTSGNVNYILVWVRKPFEKKIKQAFRKALATRKQKQMVADMKFFETVVRLHREGEGVKYTGIKPASTELNPAVVSADKAVDGGQISDTKKLLTESMQNELEKRFNKVLATKNYDVNNVDAGREYVEAYVNFVHYVEHVYNAQTSEREVGSEPYN